MDVIDTINTRRSIRRFLDLPVEWDNVVAILEAGRMAPSSGNIQNWKFILITDPEQRMSVAEACLEQYWVATAPLLIVVVAEPHQAELYYGDRGKHLYTTQNCAAAITNMLLVTHELGLGSCWVGAFEDDMLMRAANIPEGIIPQAVLPIGYPDEKPVEVPRHDVEVFVRFGAYGMQWKTLADATREYSDLVQIALKKGKEWWKKIKERVQDVT